MTVEQLDTSLRRFYVEARNKSGESYSKSTVLGFRHSFERFLNAPLISRGLKLSSDPRFKRSNEVLNAQIVRLKRQGKENVTHKPAIKSEDWWSWKPRQPLHWVVHMPSFAMCGFMLLYSYVGEEEKVRGSWRKRASSFKLKRQEEDLLQWRMMKRQKTIPEGVSDVSSSERLARMYETPEENDRYKALKFYMAKLNPQCDAFFQYPRKNSK